MPEKAPPIVLRHISKQFRVRGREQRLGFLGDSSRRRRDKTLVALDDIDLTVQPGETLGIVGLNGSGKSTLLKILAGITPATSGEVHVNGRIGSLIELGAGFHMELSGLENVYLNGTILGIGREEIDRRLPRIIEYSGLERFMDMPVKHYSSGMQLRLGFAIAIQLDPEILLLDETMSTGDAAFQPKALGTVLEFKERGVTTLMVSHEIHAVREYADRALWLDRGRMRMLGPAHEVIDAYRDDFVSRFDQESVLVAALHGDRLLAEPRADDSPIEITDLTVDNTRDGQLDLTDTDRFVLRAAYRCRRPVNRVRVAAVLLRTDNYVAIDRDSERDGQPITALSSEGTVILELTIPRLSDNAFRLVVAFYDPDVPDRVLDRRAIDLRIKGQPQPCPQDGLFFQEPCGDFEHHACAPTGHGK